MPRVNDMAGYLYTRERSRNSGGISDGDGRTTKSTRRKRAKPLTWTRWSCFALAGVLDSRTYPNQYCLTFAQILAHCKQLPYVIVAQCADLRNVPSAVFLVMFEGRTVIGQATLSNTKQFCQTRQPNGFHHTWGGCNYLKAGSMLLSTSGPSPTHPTLSTISPR